MAENRVIMDGFGKGLCPTSGLEMSAHLTTELGKQERKKNRCNEKWVEIGKSRFLFYLFLSYSGGCFIYFSFEVCCTPYKGTF